MYVCMTHVHIEGNYNNVGMLLKSISPVILRPEKQYDNCTCKQMDVGTMADRISHHSAT